VASNNGTPHTVYAIPEKFLRPPQRPANTPCSALICPGLGGDCLDSTQFYTLNALPLPAYQPGVHLLVLSGCIPGSGDATTCGSDFNITSGNAKVSSIELQAYTDQQPNDFLVQYAQLSAALSGQAISVSFGALGTTGSAFTVPSVFGSVSPPTPLRLAFDRADAQVYGSDGFRVAVQGLTISQSLASIQELSAPQALPEDFYSTRSSFVLLLLGDPADTAPTGGPKTPTTDPGRAVHLLGVPVGQPYASDGGLDSGPYDGGRSDASDAGGSG
jgi:hypothetical protein